MKRILQNIFFAELLVSVFISCSSSKPEKNDRFVSLAYVALHMVEMDKMEPEEIPAYLDTWRWDGITDICLIGETFCAGKDGTLCTEWNQEEWPEVFEGLDYKGDPIREDKQRDILCPKPVLQTVVKYFKDKNMKMWVSVKASGWLTGGSFGEVIVDDAKLRKYTASVCDFAREFGFDGIDFDWEFPTSPETGDGYRKMMKLCREAGFEVSVCAIQPNNAADYSDDCLPGKVSGTTAGRYMKWDEIVEDGYVDRINVMQYLAYNDKTKQMDLDLKSEKMAAWEKTYPTEFTAGNKIDFLCGIGFYSWVLPEKRMKKEGKSKNFTKLYELYGEEAYTSRLVGGSNAVWSTDDVRKIVRMAKERGWSGVFTWLVTHDFDKSHPDSVSRQFALSQEIQSIWDEQSSEK